GRAPGIPDGEHQPPQALRAGLRRATGLGFADRADPQAGRSPESGSPLRRPPGATLRSANRHRLRRAVARSNDPNDWRSPRVSGASAPAAAPAQPPLDTRGPRRRSTAAWYAGRPTARSR